MRKRHDLEMLKQLSKLSDLQREEKRAILKRAMESDRAADASVCTSRDVAEDAMSDWNTIVQEGLLDPLHLQHAVVGVAKSEREYETSLMRSKVAHEEADRAAIAFYSSDAQVTWIQSAFVKTRKRKAREHEERQLEEVQDRCTYQWVIQNDLS